MMETYEQKVERVAKAFYYSLCVRGTRGWEREVEYHKKRYLNAAKAALEEEARDIETDEAEIEAPKVKAPPKPKHKRKLTLPMFAGQRVMCRDGLVREVERIEHGDTARYTDGELVWAENKTSLRPIRSGGRGHARKGILLPHDAMNDVMEDSKDGW